VTVLEGQELGPKAPRFKIAETTNIYNAIVNTCKAGGLQLVSEREMCARKKYNEGKITLEELTEIIGRNVEDDTEEEKKDTNGPKDFNLLFSGAVKEELLKSIRAN